MSFETKSFINKFISETCDSKTQNKSDFELENYNQSSNVNSKKLNNDFLDLKFNMKHLTDENNRLVIECQTLRDENQALMCKYETQRIQFDDYTKRLENIEKQRLLDKQILSEDLQLKLSNKDRFLRSSLASLTQNYKKQLSEKEEKIFQLEKEKEDLAKIVDECQSSSIGVSIEKENCIEKSLSHETQNLKSLSNSKPFSLNKEKNQTENLWAMLIEDILSSISVNIKPFQNELKSEKEEVECSSGKETISNNSNNITKHTCLNIDKSSFCNSSLKMSSSYSSCTFCEQHKKENSRLMIRIEELGAEIEHSLSECADKEAKLELLLKTHKNKNNSNFTHLYNTITMLEQRLQLLDSHNKESQAKLKQVIARQKFEHRAKLLELKQILVRKIENILKDSSLNLKHNKNKNAWNSLRKFTDYNDSSTSTEKVFHDIEQLIDQLASSQRSFENLNSN